MNKTLKIIEFRMKHNKSNIKNSINFTLNIMNLILNLINQLKRI